ncbi:MAG: 30S ribosomal protein S8 [Patescibacteria group bacterium]
MTDPIADMLTRIRNASNVKKTTVSLPYSRLKKSLADILAQEGYLGGVSVVEQGKFREIELTLKYDHEKGPAIRTLKRLSKPGCRRYVQTENIPSVMNNYGIMILSTSKGLMTNRDARKAHIGGEMICEIA